MWKTIAPFFKPHVCLFQLFHFSEYLLYNVRPSIFNYLANWQTQIHFLGNLGQILGGVTITIIMNYLFESLYELLRYLDLRINILPSYLMVVREAVHALDNHKDIQIYYQFQLAYIEGGRYCVDS